MKVLSVHVHPLGIRNKCQNNTLNLKPIFGYLCSFSLDNDQKTASLASYWFFYLFFFPGSDVVKWEKSEWSSSVGTCCHGDREWTSERWEGMSILLNICHNWLFVEFFSYRHFCLSFLAEPSRKQVWFTWPKVTSPKLLVLWGRVDWIQERYILLSLSDFTVCLPYWD